MHDSTKPIPDIPLAYCDWLDVTFPTGSPTWDSVSEFLADHQAIVKRVGDDDLDFRLPSAEWGNFRLSTSRFGWSRISASGGSCGALRDVSAFGEYLALIGVNPHTVTRLDACVDFRVPAQPAIEALVARYPPESKIYLTRKFVSPKYNLQPVTGGGFTGSFMAGDPRGNSKVFARVYDKQAERLYRGYESGPWLRYEVVTRKGMGATLRDAHDPTSLFWHFAAPALLNRPDGLAPWVPFTDDTWSPGAMVSDPFQRLKRRVDFSADLDSMIALADTLAGDGRLHLLSLLRSRLDLRGVSVA